MDNMQIQFTTVQLNPIQVKQFVMMEFLSSLGVFELKNGRVIIDFNREGAIGNVDIIRHYKPETIDRVAKID